MYAPGICRERKKVREEKVVMKARVWGVGGLGGFICAVEMSVPVGTTR